VFIKPFILVEWIKVFLFGGFYMHLADGLLPATQWPVYGAVSAGVIALGVKEYYRKSVNRLDYEIMSGVFTAFVFMVTVFEIPMPFGSTEHPTGTPLMSIFMGPLITPFLSAVVLLLELLLRDGGLTTLGANVFSLGIIGGITGWGVFFTLRRFKAGLFLAGFAAGLLGDLSVYLATAIELSLANIGKHAFWFYFYAYLPGQVPLAVIEGIFTGIVLQFIYKRRAEMLKEFGVIK
jgi:cobalt/nickel transport system permease protein